MTEADDTQEPSGHSDEAQRCGFVAIIGRPNVGKSTLMNALVGEKLAITSRKPQTTRHRLHGVRMVGNTQLVFVDTPGFQTRHASALNRVLNRTVQSTLADVSVVLFVVEAGWFGADDAKLLPLIQDLPKSTPVLLIANKLDRVKDRDAMLPWLKEMSAQHAFAAQVPLSAKDPQAIGRLTQLIAPLLPASEWLFDPEALTDRSEKFLASEIIREKLFRLTGDELPYSSTVVIDKFEEQPGRSAARFLKIYASVLVEKDSHKAMIIGDAGEKMKRISTEARVDMEKLFDAKVYLEVWVKVKSGWAETEAKLRAYGYE